MRQLTRTLSAVTLALLAGFAVEVVGQEVSAEDCAVCHEEIVAHFGQTTHGISGRGGPDCAYCHTNGLRHMDEGGDPRYIEVPEGIDGERMCLDCHAQTHTMFSGRSVHSDRAVACGSCHSIHSPAGAGQFLLADESSSICATCHPAIRNSFRRPYGHRLDRGGLECVSCHNPHGGDGEQSLNLDRSGEGPCVTCHAEKRGPFAFPHVSGFAGDCMSCHQPHGSTNPMGLTRPRVDQLCLECHSRITPPDTFGSQPPSFHDVSSPFYRECTVCHVAIHGSNLSPGLLK
jgi:DmsE family decaheme c-type cytochrome